MSTYAIGDIQGCFDPLKRLLDLIQFDPNHDSLWFTGDIVNRGPKSLETLRFIYSLGDKHKTVLGNHDLHLLAVAYGVRSLYPDDTLTAILNADDRDELLDWLRHRPLLWREQDYVMVHAGLAPSWNGEQAALLAKEVELALQSQPKLFLQNMIGNIPDHWDDHLTHYERLRCITNYFTRMRFCYSDGRLDFSYKGDIAHCPNELSPWFLLSSNHSDLKIIFGHWAALDGITEVEHVFPLDTGCVWGKCLTAMRLEDHAYFKVTCRE
jgi:bis(5'-nucleosyl)-tetraphosphatase (symmetrical)